MIFGSVSEYAIRGLSELATPPPDTLVMLDDLIGGTELPRDFMAKIFNGWSTPGCLPVCAVKGLFPRW